MADGKAKNKIGVSAAPTDILVPSEEQIRPDPRRVRTRYAIILAGRKLFGEHHPDGVGIDELIAAARISRQSFYNHFPDKEALAREILHDIRITLQQLIRQANAEQPDPARRVATAMCIYAHRATTDLTEGRLIARLPLGDIATESAVNSGVLADVRDGLAKGRLAVLTPAVGVAFIIGTTQSLISQILMDGNSSMAVVTTQQFVTLVLRAFGLPPIEAEIIASEAVDRVFRR
ncbi:TetR/AcrR family transcriptional regulator [Niveispirillum sp.]|uniref:TetR/AcrR family transcriptional regulator n=1 Tax=Niveispirillum sp. TaxID=1917217 RepID=UPI001B7070B3|nr:TetR/AcrR family transcriptional regulator [Niveispirillum sp.]MBP7338630.1 TetR/AcrR family transcriptional regulator [Niveispirillum sp.]